MIKELRVDDELQKVPREIVLKVRVTKEISRDRGRDDE